MSDPHRVGGGRHLRHDGRPRRRLLHQTRIKSIASSHIGSPSFVLVVLLFRSVVLVSRPSNLCHPLSSGDVHWLVPVVIDVVLQNSRGWTHTGRGDPVGRESDDGSSWSLEAGGSDPASISVGHKTR